jgi:antitoxin YefM
MAVTAREARKRLTLLIAQVNADRAPIEITSEQGDAMLMSLEDYRALEETAYLLRSPANVRRLLDSLDQAGAARLSEPDLDR